MGVNNDYAQKKISGRAEKKKPQTPKHDVATNDVKEPREQPFSMKDRLNIFSGMNLVNWILAAGLVYAIYIAHQNSPKAVIASHIDILEERFEALKMEIMGDIDQKIDAKLDDIPWQVREFAKVQPRPGQSLILYWQKGEGEVVEFDPARAKERDLKLQGK